MSDGTYVSNWESRYASKEMLELFSPRTRHLIWRKLWLALAEAECELGLPVTQHQVKELKVQQAVLDYPKIAKYESELKHDVMAHIHAWGDVCPAAKPIIHLGATSCYVTDNGDLLQMKQGLGLLLLKLKNVLIKLADFAAAHRSLACLGYTHFQAAQLTTVGKRASLWLQDLFWDYRELQMRHDGIAFLGVKGATGTQASFLELFEGDQELVKMLELLVAKKMGFSSVLTIASQTYPRKQDFYITQALVGLAISAHKMATDLRLWSHLKEVEEGFSKKQIGSSAMPHKRNPILSERICGLARYLIALGENPTYTAALQWMERSLDDSANRRFALSDSFLAADAILNLLETVVEGLVVNPVIIQKNLASELPFLATETILMQAVKKGGDRQALHEQLRQLSQKASLSIKNEGRENNLLDLIAKDKTFNLTKKELAACLNPQQFIGNAAIQVEAFIKEELLPALN